jgi:endonuclease IV
MKYPFLEDTSPEKNRINILDIPTNLKTNNMKESFYPNIISDNCVYISGKTKDNWENSLECLFVWACEHKIPNMIFIWSSIKYYHISISNFNWQSGYVKPPDFLNHLIDKFNIGSSIGMSSSVRNTLLICASNGPFQMFISPNKNPHISKIIPTFNYDNIPAFDVIKERNLNVFCHSALNMNIARFDESKYISNLLKYCTAHAMKGVVFHVGTNKDIAPLDAKNKMMENIVLGIRNSLPHNTLFLLETPAGEGNEMFSDIYDFIRFCLEIRSIPDISNNFGVCVDTCHVFQSNYDPYNYLVEIINYLPVHLIHFNDSEKEWGGKRDRHAKPGEGKIPWIYLYKVAQLAQAMKISMVLEINH